MMNPDESYEVQWGAALDAADLGTFYAEGPTFDTVRVSKSYWRQFRLERDQQILSLEQILERIHSEDREAIRLKREQAVHERSLYNAEYRMATRDGGTAWINAVGKVTPLSDGKEVFAGVTFDITKRKTLELQLSALYERDNRIAETFQRLLMDLPTLPISSGLECATFYEAYSKDGSSVGGDFLDVVVVDENRTAFVVGDVQGHKLQSAAVALEVKLALHAYLSAKDSPSVALNKLNTFAIDRNWSATHDVCFALATICLVDSSNQTVEVAMAGGYPPIIICDKQETQFSREQSSVPIGVDRRATYISHCIELNDDYLMTLFTDGLTELRNENKEQFEVDGLLSLLRSTRSYRDRHHLSELGQTIMDTAKAHATEITDDICLMLVRPSRKIG
jgi:serine phosphatase RsbU (regulator of sigma subunit)